MGFYIKHIISIDEDSSRDKLEQLAELIDKHAYHKLDVYDDHLDDASFDCGSGGINYGINEFVREEISEEFGEIPFTVHCVDENEAIYEYYCYDGGVNESTIRESPEWYKHYEDKSLRAPGAREGYYDDHGLGEPYPIPYGKDGHLPGGVIWWID